MTEQPALIPAPEQARRAAASGAERARRRARPPSEGEPAPDLPVARVLVDVPLPHLDRPFDYLVPAPLAQDVVPGARVKVRFAGKDADGFVLARVAASDHEGRLAPLRRAVSPEPVLTPEVAALCAAVAERYAGTRSDVLRLAVPPRHARVEKEPPQPAAPWSGDLASARAWWTPYDGGAALVTALASGAGPRAAATLAPGDDWAAALAHAAAATASSGRGALLCVPDRRDLDRLDAALTETLGTGHHVTLTADAGPAARYRAFLQVSRGTVRVVAGTRAAAFAPVHDLGLVALWDDGDDLYDEPRAPYCHTREVLLLRAHATGCGVLLAGRARTAEVAAMVQRGWLRGLARPRHEVRARAPRVEVAGATEGELARDPFARSSRIPRSAQAAVRAALGAGPVLVCVPRAGYAPALACGHCGSAVRCPRCAGPVAVLRAGAGARCAWCDTAHDGRCADCAHATVRAPVVGDRRTAEELGRSFPAVPVRRSSGERVLEEVGPEPALVVATPGAEPPAAGGYAAVLLLDTWLLLARPDLRAPEEAARRWFNAASLARSSADGGRVVAVGDPAEPALQALVRWDPVGLAERELGQRVEAHLPPAARVAVLTAPEEALAAFTGELVLPPGAELLGPVSVATAPEGPARRTDEAPLSRIVLRVPRSQGAALSRALLIAQGVRSAHKRTPVRVQVDPVVLG